MSAGSGDEFAREVMRRAIARTCVALGFKNAEASVLDALADVMRGYNLKLATQTLAIAELHGRVQPGMQDLLKALEELVSQRVTNLT